MSLPYDDNRPLLPVLSELYDNGTLSNRIYHAFSYAAHHTIRIPTTVGALRQALRESGTPQLRYIPRVGPASIARLRALFCDDPPT